jgi:hypothetical protein
MKAKRLMWNQVDRTKIPLDRLVEEYLLVCRTEGKSPKTLRGYREKLGRFCRWLDGNLGAFTLQTVRTYIGELQRARKYEDHPHHLVQEEGLASITIKGHAVVLNGLAIECLQEIEAELDGHPGIAKLKAFVTLTRQGMGVTEASRTIGVSPEYATRTFKRTLVELLTEKLLTKLR